MGGLEIWEFQAPWGKISLGWAPLLPTTTCQSHPLILVICTLNGPMKVKYQRVSH
jgi:hypothetical protein